MRKIYFCLGILVALIIFVNLCENYVTNTVRDTSELLIQSVESRESGDLPQSREYIDTAWDKWRSLCKKSNLVLSDLTIVADVTVSLSRVISLSETDDDDRFTEECSATIMLLEHFAADNKNVFGGVLVD
ncbi:MAG: DUF4363 family protein [Oscillospiraceae bacterium]|nr:DUF4363 family protein [Oscillospiraceae bacterium]